MAYTALTFTHISAKAGRWHMNLVIVALELLHSARVEWVLSTAALAHLMDVRHR